MDACTYQSISPLKLLIITGKYVWPFLASKHPTANVGGTFFTAEKRKKMRVKKYDDARNIKALAHARVKLR